ncbi:hypothetical protein COO91_03007 [Nostoc flagelliforme CCNUN1]|uniref:Uncharacterized protein n=1 Tax=Nostoc flagelliforme CCNUN1 TaxID=2038116 RepID=A0A2K8SQJ7_9NOSO|nr:hypothetical protein COO91_03007 [Nostoc flagelliforme CCNUN1]
MVLPICGIDLDAVGKQIQMRDQLRLHHYAFGHLPVRRYLWMTPSNISLTIPEWLDQLMNL